jgi:hypothetical protein
MRGWPVSAWQARQEADESVPEIEAFRTLHFGLPPEVKPFRISGKFQRTSSPCLGVH